jgi:hypothetical protein
MYTRILTDLERRRVKKYLSEDGKRDALIRKLAHRKKAYEPTIRADLALLDELARKYEKQKTR